MKKNSIGSTECTLEEQDFILDLPKFNKLKKFNFCFVCLEILFVPMQCDKCESLVCDMCLLIMTIKGIKCFSDCEGNYRKANKFIREFLSLSTFHCNECKKDLEYNMFYSPAHIESCNKSLHNKEKLVQKIKSNVDSIFTIENEICTLKSKHKILNKFNNSKLLNMPMETLRQSLLSFDLSIDQKMELYYACTEGKLETLKTLINIKSYPILEEISYKNYYWTPLHYAMHYGQYEIVKYILDQLKEVSLVEPALKLQSNDGRCPLLCLLKSNHLTDKKKEEIIENLFKSYMIGISKEVKREMHLRGFDKILKKYNKI